MQRNIGLDLARSAAITLIVCVHHLVLFPVSPITQALQWGALATLDLFFSLSGFLIGGILIRMSEPVLTPRTMGIYLFRRWMRTLPAYYVTLVFVCWFFGNWGFHPFLLMQNFYPDEPRLLVVSWSLVLEEYFYLLFPLAMLALTRLLGGGTRLVAAVAVGLIAACTLGHVADIVHLQTLDHDTLTQNPFLRMDCCAYGVLAACVNHAWPNAIGWIRARHAPLMAATLAALFALGGLFAVTINATPDGLVAMGYRSWGAFYQNFFTSTQQMICAMLVLLLYLHPPPMSRWFQAAITYVSVYSYSIYLTHAVVMVLVSYYLPHWYHGIIGVAVSFAGIFAATVLLHHTVERPGMYLRDTLPPALARLSAATRRTIAVRVPAIARRLPSGSTSAALLAVGVALCTLAVFGVRARVGLVTLEFGDETEKYVVAAMLRHGHHLYRDVFANHGPLAYALAWLSTFAFGTFDFTRTRLVVVVVALLACAALVFSPALARRGPGRLWAATLFLAPVSAFWFVHPLHMLIYHALGGYLMVVVLAQLTVPALLGMRVGPWSAGLAGAASVLAAAASYPFVVPAGLFTVAALLVTGRTEAAAAARAVRSVLAGAAVAAAPLAVWMTVHADWAGFVAYHLYFNQVVYARVLDLSPVLAVNALLPSLAPIARAHSFALAAGALGLLAAMRWRASDPARWAALGLTALGLVALNPKGARDFPDTAQMIACFGLLALAGAYRLALTRGRELVAGIAVAGLFVVAAEGVARSALVSPHGMPRAEAPIVYLRPDPTDQVAQEIRRLVPVGSTFLALPFMPAAYVQAARAPSSGAFYYLPFQAEYDKAPVLGRHIDLCDDIARTRPGAIVVAEQPFPVWGSVLDYTPCLARLLIADYRRSASIPFIFVRHDDTPREASLPPR